jgi:hypothetical protein
LRGIWGAPVPTETDAPNAPQKGKKFMNKKKEIEKAGQPEISQPVPTETDASKSPASDTLNQILAELQAVKSELAQVKSEQKASTDMLAVRGKSALKVVNPADKDAYRDLVDRYSKQNPVKFERKKAELEAKLNS